MFLLWKEFEIGKSALGDHVIPDALGGKPSFLNVCSSCNIQLNDNLDIHLMNFSLRVMILELE